MLLLVFALAQTSPGTADLQTANTPRAFLFRASNKWLACAGKVGTELVKQAPTMADAPTVTANAALNACEDERAAFHALAVEMIRKEAPEANADLLAAETEARIRIGLVESMVTAQEKAAHR